MKQQQRKVCFFCDYYRCMTDNTDMNAEDIKEWDYCSHPANQCEINISQKADNCRFWKEC